MSGEVVFTRTDPLGEFSVRHADPAADAELVHRWVTHPKAVFWMMQDATVADVADELHRIADRSGHDAFLGMHDGQPVFLVERYDPRRELGEGYPVRPGDVGMHFLVAPTSTPVAGFTRAVLVTVMELLFADPATRRVVVEPDTRNTAVHALNAYVGFQVLRVVALPKKQALLSVCTRASYRDARAAAGGAVDGTLAHLTPEYWDRANRMLVRKALAEFAHERLVLPTPLPDGRYAVTTDDGAGEYRFVADRLALDHWHLDPDRITRLRDGAEQPLDLVDLVLELRERLGLAGQQLPVYLEELTSTLASAAYRLAAPAPSAAELARAGTDFQTVEAAMTEGHPCFVANSGRLGFSSTDYRRYAPETGRAVRLHWVAARWDRASFSCGRGIDYDQLMDAELGPAARDRFAAVLGGQRLDPSEYLLVPVHPWQWRNRLSVTFAGDLARRELVWLGAGEDEYQPQQSIRTFFNRSAPAKHYVKTALSVLNMGFLRGLSAAYMAGTPAINDWVADLIAGDPLLRKNGFTILRERAAVGYRHAQFHAATPAGSPYRKMLAALWRESPVPSLGPGERPVTMASLLHVDRAGASLASALIAGSGMAPAAWLRRYLDAYLLPILHCFYAYDLVFMPHGENVILVLDQHGVPDRALFKDIAEEIGVMNADVALPPEVERVRAVPPQPMRTLSILVDVFDCFFRFLSAVLHTDGTLHQDRFWASVAACVRDYQDSTPELAERFDRDNLFAARFDRSCLNRLQLRDNQQMVDLDDPDPTGGLQFAGTLDNPIAGKETG